MTRKEQLKKAMDKWLASPQGKSSRKKYRESKAGKAIVRAAMKRYRLTDKGIKYGKQYETAHKDQRRQRDMKRHHGISLEDKSRMIRSQDNRCMICKQAFTNSNGPCVDPDHAAGNLRDILCRKCNCALGLLNDSIERLEMAAAYLKKWKK